MKLLKIITITFCFALATNANAQLLKKLSKKAEKAAERTLERKVEEKTERETEKSFDSIFNNQAKLFKGNQKLAVQHIPAFTEFLGLDKRQQEFFSELVLFTHAKSNEVSQKHFNRLEILKGLKFDYVGDESEEFHIPFPRKNVFTVTTPKHLF